ncbi:hypothetical protein FB451DRAFT_1500563 [Mycena latifolia]|nr:hypothetical protein FB451DRAFT_1500563 [Mycena latifolia]
MSDRSLSSPHNSPHTMRRKNRQTSSPPAINSAMDMASTTLEVALKILGLLSDVTENVPYLNTITGCIQKLIDIQKAMGDNKKRADDLLSNIGEVSRTVTQGLHDLEAQKRITAASRLHDDLQRYQTVLDETCVILEDWTSKSFVKRVWAHGDFAGIADGIDR